MSPAPPARAVAIVPDAHRVRRSAVWVTVAGRTVRYRTAAIEDGRIRGGRVWEFWRVVAEEGEA